MWSARAVGTSPPPEGLQPGRSDAWFSIAERLQAACWRVGSATHCLREWREPDDARVDVDDRCDAGDDMLASRGAGPCA